MGMAWTHASICIPRLLNKTGAVLQSADAVLHSAGEVLQSAGAVLQSAGAVSYTHLTLPTTPYV